MDTTTSPAKVEQAVYSVLQGNNNNLLVFKSSKIEKHLTLEKLNKEIRLISKNHNVVLKFLQTHKNLISLII